MIVVEWMDGDHDDWLFHYFIHQILLLTEFINIQVNTLEEQLPERKVSIKEKLYVKKKRIFN